MGGTRSTAATMADSSPGKDEACLRASASGEGDRASERLRLATARLRARLDDHARALGIDPRWDAIERARVALIEAARRAARAQRPGEADRALDEVIHAAARLDVLHGGR